MDGHVAILCLNLLYWISVCDTVGIRSTIFALITANFRKTGVCVNFDHFVLGDGGTFYISKPVFNLVPARRMTAFDKSPAVI